MTLSVRAPLNFVPWLSNTTTTTRKTHNLSVSLGLPQWLHGNESACSAGDRVPSLDWEDSPEKGMATHSSILAWEIPWSLVGYSPWGHKESDMTE